MDFPNAYEKIVKLLIARSQRNEVVWTKRTKWQFAINFPTFSFSVWEYHDDDDPRYSGIAFEILNESGEQIDHVAVGEGQKGYSDLRELYQLARRRAYGVDHVLETFSSILQNAKVVGGSEGY